MSLKTYNQWLEDKTAEQNFFSCSRKQVGPVNTDTDQQFTKNLGFIVQKIFEKLFFLTAIKFNSFQWKSINTLRYNP